MARHVVSLLAWLVVVLLPLVAEAQSRGRTSAPPSANDPRLMAIYRDFVLKAEKLALEYEGDEHFEQAKALYQQILKLTPDYERAQQRLKALQDREATAERVVVPISATEAWQDTGVIVLQGKPVNIRATGAWTFNLSAQLGPAGMEIPKDLREFNLGSLVGFVETGTTDEKEKKAQKPFMIGAAKSFVAEKTGLLYLRMYDIDPSDNRGAVQVEIQGTFQQKSRK